MRWRPHFALLAILILVLVLLSGCVGPQATVDGLQVILPSEAATGHEAEFRLVNSYPEVVYHWFFGDGNDSTGQSPRHTYTMEGLYDILVNASFRDSSKEYFGQLHVSYVPRINILNPGLGQEVTATAELHGNKYNITEIVWLLEGAPRSYQSTINATFNYAGSYRFLLQVSDDINRTHEAEYILRYDPIVNVTFSDSHPIVGKAITIWAEIAEVEGNVTRGWRINPSPQSQRSHTDDSVTFVPARSGSHTIDLRVQGTNNLDYTHTMTLNIAEPPKEYVRLDRIRNTGSEPVTVTIRTHLGDSSWSVHDVISENLGTSGSDRTTGGGSMKCGEYMEEMSIIVRSRTSRAVLFEGSWPQVCNGEKISVEIRSSQVVIEHSGGSTVRIR